MGRVRQHLQEQLDQGIFDDQEKLRYEYSIEHALRFTEVNDTGYIVVLPFLCAVDGESDLVDLVYSSRSEFNSFEITACLDGEGNVEVSGYRSLPEGDVVFNVQCKSHEECLKVISWTSL